MAQAKAGIFAHATRRSVLGFLVAAGALPAALNPAVAATAQTIDKNVDAAMKRLLGIGPEERALVQDAAGVLMFPNITKGGFIFGAQFGEGALRQNGKTTAYYSILAGSYGLQIGLQSFSYALIFRNPGALAYLDRSDGWSIGSGPSLVVLDKGTAHSLTSTTLTQDVVAIPFAHSGLMAGLGLEGSKITRIGPR